VDVTPFVPAAPPPTNKKEVLYTPLGHVHAYEPDPLNVSIVCVPTVVFELITPPVVEVICTYFVLLEGVPLTLVTDRVTGNAPTPV
jgi:hypothetical protein